MAAANLAAGDMVYRTTTTGATSGLNTTGGKLWLPIWAGEVINAYDEYNMYEPLVTSRTIPSGTTIEFPITGTVALNPAWDAGEELVGDGTNTATTIQVKLDKRPMAAHFEIDNVDMMLTQWEFRSELARQAAMTLANTRDKQVYSHLCRAALTSQATNDTGIRGDFDLEKLVYGGVSDVVGSDTRMIGYWGASAASSTNRATGALSALESIEKFIVHLQENNIPYGNLYMVCSPQSFMDVRALGVARDSDDLGMGSVAGTRPYFGGVSEEGGLGVPYRQGLGKLHDSLEYMGCTILKSNHVGEILGDTSAGNTIGEDKYNLDFTSSQTNTTAVRQGVRAVMWTPECVAGIRLQGLKVDTVDDVRRNTTFTVASMMGGLGVLRPECVAMLHGFSDPQTAGDTSRDRTALRAAGFFDVSDEGLGFPT
jgi:hypothetical protein